MKTNLSNTLRALTLGALCLAQPTFAAIKPLDRVAAIVDNDVVMQSQVQTRLREVQQTIQRRGADMPPNDILSQQVLERLITESLQLQIADRSGIRVDDEELNHAVEEIAMRNGMNLDQFRQALANDGLSFQEAREQIRREILINRVRQRRIAERIQVSDQELNNFLASDLGRMQLSEEYRLASILLPIPEAASYDQIAKAERQAEEIYAQLRDGADFARLAMTYSASENALDGGEMGWRKAAQLPPPFDGMVRALSPGESAPPVRTPGGIILLKLHEKRGGESQVREQVNVRHILIKPSEIRTPAETERLINRLHDRVTSGEDFATLAKQFSEDPGSALNGGELNWIDPESLVPAFRQVMANTASGQLSRPFQSPYGWHILEVMGRRATDSGAQMREQQAMNLLRNRKYEEELQIWLRQIRDEAYVDIKI